MIEQTLPNPSGDISALPSAVAPSPAAEQVASEILAPVEKQLENFQEEISALQQEVNVLRRRDETLKFYMHRVDEEMRLAARLQQDFLPKQLPQIGRVRFHTIF